MNTRLDHIIGCNTEEAGEVQQIIGKIIRFGLYDHHPKKRETNFTELRKEVHDLVAVFQMLCFEVGEDTALDPKMIIAKQDRVEEYMKYARDIGQLEA